MSTVKQLTHLHFAFCTSYSQLVRDAQEASYEFPSTCPLAPALDIFGKVQNYESRRHGKEPTCSKCGKSFVSPYYLHRHLIRVHVKEDVCSQRESSEEHKRHASVCLADYCSILGCDIEMYTLARASQQSISIPGSSFTNEEGYAIDEVRKLLDYHLVYFATPLETSSFMDGANIGALPPPFAVPSSTAKEEIDMTNVTQRMVTRNMWSNGRETVLRTNGHVNGTGFDRLLNHLTPCPSSQLKIRRHACYNLLDTCFPIRDKYAAALNALYRSGICERLHCAPNDVAPVLPPTKGEFTTRLRHQFESQATISSHTSNEHSPQQELSFDPHWNWRDSNAFTSYVWDDSSISSLEISSPYIELKEAKVGDKLGMFDRWFTAHTHIFESTSPAFKPMSLHFLWKICLGILGVGIFLGYMILLYMSCSLKKKVTQRRNRGNPLGRQLKESEELLEQSQSLLVQNPQTRPAPHEFAGLPYRRQSLISRLMKLNSNEEMEESPQEW